MCPRKAPINGIIACVCGHARQASSAGVWTCIWSSSLFNTDAVPQGLTGPVNASHKHASRLICHLQASACLDSARCWIVIPGKGLWSKCAHVLVHAPNWSCSGMPRLDAPACNTHLQVFAIVFPVFQHSNNGCSLYIYLSLIKRRACQCKSQACQQIDLPLAGQCMLGLCKVLDCYSWERTLVEMCTCFGTHTKLVVLGHAST